MNRVIIIYKKKDVQQILPLIERIEASVGGQCLLCEDEENNAPDKAVETMRNINEADVIILMYSHLHASITNYSTDWTIRALNYAHEKQKRIVFVSIDQTPLTKWFDFMFPQQRLIEADKTEQLDQLLNNLPIWLNTINTDNTPVTQAIPFTKGLEYSFDEATKEATIIGWGAVRDTHIQIPTTVIHNGVEYKVRAIGKKAFKDACFIISVHIPDTVTRIGRSAFENCVGLASIIIPNGVTDIERNTFYKCTNLMYIVLPDSITNIHMQAFIFCNSLVSVDIPNGLQRIGYEAFGNCSNLTTISIPSSVKRISIFAFWETNLPQAKKTHRNMFAFAQILSYLLLIAIIAFTIYFYFHQ